MLKRKSVAILTSIIIPFTLLFITLAIIASRPSGVVHAATLQVDSTDLNCSDVGGGPYCTIQAAVNAASTDDVILVSSSVYTENVTVNESLTIQGSGSDITIVNGDGPTRTFKILAPNTITITGLTITNGGGIKNWGSLFVNDVSIAGHTILTTAEPGGGVANYGMMRIFDSQVNNNEAFIGAGIYNAPTGTLILSNTAVNNNLAVGLIDSYGGGIFNAGVLSITAGTLYGNNVNGKDWSGYIAYPSGYGAGIFNEGLATISGTTITDNSSQGGMETLGGHSYGGGIYNAGVISLTSVTISRNGSTGGGCCAIGGNGYGGSIYNIGTVVLSNVVINSNRAIGGGRADLGGLGFGGGIYNGGELLFEGGDISSNVVLGHDAGYILGSGGSAYGGGVYNSVTGKATFSDMLSENNDANAGNGDGTDGGSGTGSGGSLYNSGTMTLTESIIRSNSARTRGSSTGGGYGGGLFATGPLNMSNIVIVSNNSETSGGGIYIESISPTLVHSTISSNTSGDGSGMFITDDLGSYGESSLINTILVSHTVGISVTAGNSVTLNSILWFGNSINVGGSGNISITNPLNGDPAFTSDGYHISESSAAKDVGIDAGIYLDIDGDTRPWGDDFDLGADEFTPAPVILPPQDLEITGPVVGEVGSYYAFTATVEPITTTTPLNYIWSADDHEPINQINGLSNTLSYIWSLPGMKFITVTAENAGGSVTATHQITISDNTAPNSSASSPAYANSSPIPVDWTASDTALINSPRAIEEVALWAKKGGEIWSDSGMTQTGSSGTFNYVATTNERYCFATVTKDTAGNQEALPTGDGDSCTVFDTTAPSSTASAPAEASSASVEVSWTANDNLSGMDKVELWVRFDGGEWQESGLPVQSGTSGAFTYSFAWGNGTYGFVTRAIDKAENEEALPDSADATTIYQGGYFNYLPMLTSN